jgi:hypothetical protein
MPKGNGNGRIGQGSGRGQGMGSGRGQGMGSGRGQGMGSGGGRGRGGGFGRGPEGECLCPKCGKQVPHERGVPCTQRICPDCGIPMTRKW